MPPLIGAFSCIAVPKAGGLCAETEFNQAANFIVGHKYALAECDGR